jgi:hypothetical protein
MWQTALARELLKTYFPGGTPGSNLAPEPVVLAYGAT